MPRPPVQIVWFKRDLRVTDHAPLSLAAGLGPVLPLYVIEPAYWALPDTSGRQFEFLRESLVELRRMLAMLGQPLVVRTGDVVEVLEDLHHRLSLGALWSHEETGNAWTYARDRRVAAWARARGLSWHEHAQTGVVRRLASRDGWASGWDRRMHQPLAARPLHLMPVLELDPGRISFPQDLGIADDSCPGRQQGGRAEAKRTLRSFLSERGRPYRQAMSQPAAGAAHCSRVSPHLAHGTLSLRETLQAAEYRLATLSKLPPEEQEPWRGSLKSFVTRLRWRCHFMQKLESEPEIEHLPFHPAYAALRGCDEVRLQAWAEGRSGWPFVDACMRMLQGTGWLNFRMRAMLMAVASYQLWLDWRPAGLVLARRFTDYEPGIHWPQCQMQSGSTGINTIRIYNPVKQGQDQDPDGSFIRRWCPELAAVPLRWLHTPWLMPPGEQAAAGCLIGRHYPAPLVDHVAAAQAAREAAWSVRRAPSFAKAADRIQARHGSRRSGLPQPEIVRAHARKLADPQLDLGL